MDSNEDFLDIIAKQFPNKGVWRWQDQGIFKTRAKLLVAIRKMRKAGMDDKDIQDILDDLFFAAYAEHELQIKEKTGFSVAQYFERMKQQAEKAEPAVDLTAHVAQP